MKKAIITATKEQLEEVGCSRDLMNLELEISDIDRWVGMYGKNSTVYYVYDIGLDFKFNEDYMIPTQWLKFKNDWVLTKDKKPPFNEPIECTNDNGETIDESMVYLERRTCMMAGSAGGFGYFGKGFATNGENGCDYGLICDEPIAWRLIE